MPREYPVEKEIKPAVLARQIRVVGINIRVTDGTVTYYFEALDTNGEVVDHRTFTETIPAGVIASVVNRAEQAMTNAGYPRV